MADYYCDHKDDSGEKVLADYFLQLVVLKRWHGRDAIDPTAYTLRSFACCTACLGRAVAELTDKANVSTVRVSRLRRPATADPVSYEL